MQLSITASMPEPQPAAPYIPQDPGAGTGAQLPDSSGGFEQLLTGPNPSAPQSGQQPKKPEVPTTASEEAAEASKQNAAPAAATSLTAAGPGIPGLGGLSAGGWGMSPPKNAPGATAATNVAPGAGEPAAGKQVPEATPTWNAETSPDIVRATGAQAPASVPVNPPTMAQPVAQIAPSAALLPQETPAPSPPVGSPTGPRHGARGAPSVAAASSTPSVAGAEKIAASFQRTGGSGNAVSRGPDKKILSSDSKQVTDHNDPVGTGVAKVSPAMPTASQTERQPNALVATAPASGVAASQENAPANPQAASAQPSVAQRAVEAALSAAEIFNSGGQNAVNLQFSMGNADLSLRVELRNGEVHTTFQTDSADLRSNLAHEWQSASPSSGGNLRLAEPIFTSSSAGSLATAGENAPQQRGGQGPADTQQHAPTGAGSSAAIAAAQSEGDSQAPLPVSLATSLHLQAFA
jgi:hypothetical protein